MFVFSANWGKNKPRYFFTRLYIIFFFSGLQYRLTREDEDEEFQREGEIYGKIIKSGVNYGKKGF